MTAHKDLTGTDLHEPKGAATASANTHYAADGAGSGVWQKVTASEIDTATVFNVNKGRLSAYFADIGTASSIYIPFPGAATVTKIYTAVSVAPLTADTIITCYNSSGSSMGTITVAFTGAAVGDVDSLTPVTNNTFTAGQAIRLTTDGGASNVVPTHVVIEYTWTS